MTSTSTKFRAFLNQEFKISDHLFEIPFDFKGEENLGIYDGYIHKLENPFFIKYQYQKAASWKSINLIFSLHQKNEIIDKINSFLSNCGLNEVKDLVDQNIELFNDENLLAGLISEKDQHGILYFTIKA